VGLLPADPATQLFARVNAGAAISKISADRSPAEARSRTIPTANVHSGVIMKATAPSGPATAITPRPTDAQAFSHLGLITAANALAQAERTIP
jgi:hypothetical protein